MHVARNQLSVNRALPLSRTQEMFRILRKQRRFLPVSRANWVYGHGAWLNTLAVELGWLGAVYQGQ